MESKLKCIWKDGPAPSTPVVEARESGVPATTTPKVEPSASVESVKGRRVVHWTVVSAVAAQLSPIMSLFLLGTFCSNTCQSGGAHCARCARGEGRTSAGERALRSGSL